MTGREADRGARAGRTLGPTDARNWGWVTGLGGFAGLLLAGAAEAALGAGRAGAVILPLLGALPFAAGAVWAWRAPPFERCTLRLTGEGVEIAGRREAVRLRWSEIAALTHRPRGLGGAFMTLETVAGAGPDDGPGASSDGAPAGPDGARGGVPEGVPGVMFSVRSVGVRMEDIVAFLARGAAEAGYRLEEPAATRLGAGRGALHPFAMPRSWHLRRA